MIALQLNQDETPRAIALHNVHPSNSDDLLPLSLLSLGNNESTGVLQPRRHRALGNNSYNDDIPDMIDDAVDPSSHGQPTGSPFQGDAVAFQPSSPEILLPDDNRVSLSMRSSPTTNPFINGPVETESRSGYRQ